MVKVSFGTLMDPSDHACDVKAVLVSISPKSIGADVTLASRISLVLLLSFSCGLLPDPNVLPGMSISGNSCLIMSSFGALLAPTDRDCGLEAYGKPPSTR